MNKKSSFIVFILAVTDFFLIFKILLSKTSILLLNPKGWIALQERNLMLLAVALMFIVVIPVFILVFFIAWKYREKNTKEKYNPDWDHDVKLQTLVWGVLFTIIVVLSIFNWKTAHQLDPHKALVSSVKPMIIDVVALRWKWLFIYPEQKIATVNFVAFPEKTPITFELTSDAPMNSFWIPQLGGQMYAMAGMVTPLHLIADSTGEYSGSTAELSGAGFAGMRFKAKSLSSNDFDSWITMVKQSSQALDLTFYNDLAKPSENNPQTFYGLTEGGLYNKIIDKFK